MIGLLIPFLVADLILGWMLLGAWRRKEMWMGTRMAHREESRLVYRMTLIRLAALLLLSLIGTVAALAA